MKKTLIVFGFIVFAAIAMSSCKKYYVCECTSNCAERAPSTYSRTIYATKYEAKLECETANETIFNTIMICKLK